MRHIREASTMRRVALYIRVSTDQQTTANQELELRQIATRSGWEIVEVYRDNGISGAKGRDQRPAFDMMCKDATRRRFDTVAAWSVDRLGRSLQDLVGFLSELHAAGVDLFLHQQGIDTTTPAGKAMFQMMGVFAEFERAMIRERVNAGLARARAEGKTLGRRKIATKIEKAIRADLAKGDQGIRKIARLHDVGTGTVQRIRTEMLGAR
jgi:DNA invertase Pin-like site-specific DNA recombinase